MEQEKAIVILLIMALITLVFWVLRDTPFGFFWKVWKWFWVILFATLLADFAKDEVKKWWNK